MTGTFLPQVRLPDMNLWEEQGRWLRPGGIAAWTGEGGKRTKGHLVVGAPGSAYCGYFCYPQGLHEPQSWPGTVRTQWLLVYPVRPEAVAAQRECWLLTHWQLPHSHLIHSGHFKYNPLHIIIIEDGACDVLQMQIGKCWTSFSKYVVY